MGRHDATEATEPIPNSAPTTPIRRSAPRAEPKAVGAGKPARRPPNRRLSSASPTRLAVGAAFGAIIIVAIGVIFGRFLDSGSDESGASPSSAASTTSAQSSSAAEPPPAPVPPPAESAGLSDSFASLVAGQLSGDVVGLVVAPVGGEATTLEQWSGADTAWSTIKVPLAVAGLNSDGGAALMPDVTAAITVSDNAAAERIWAALGSGQVAADKVDAVLRAAGDPTNVQPNRIRPEFTPFGQTQWPMAEQVKFLSHAACDPSATAVLDLMGQVASDRWGLGQLSGSQFKGGWGPSEQGAYLVRQIGILTDEAGGKTVVAMAVQPSGGSFGEGQTDMNTIAQWLTEHRAELPTGTCAAAQP